LIPPITYGGGAYGAGAYGGIGVPAAPGPAGAPPGESVLIPHFAFPFTFTAANGAAVYEQDSIDEILTCATLIASCPQGAWPDQPAFGIPSPLFAQAPINPNGILQSITRWEPRAVATAVEYPDAFNDAIRTVQISISSAQTDQQ
jgi:hypothetical protein